jgi:hypothetical protein
MWRRVDFVWTDVSEERIVPVFRVPPKRRFTQDLHDIPEEGILHSHRRENLKSYKKQFLFSLFCHK